MIHLTGFLNTHLLVGLAVLLPALPFLLVVRDRDRTDWLNPIYLVSLLYFLYFTLRGIHLLYNPLSDAEIINFCPNLLGDYKDYLGAGLFIFLAGFISLLFGFYYQPVRALSWKLSNFSNPSPWRVEYALGKMGIFYLAAVFARLFLMKKGLFQMFSVYGGEPTSWFVPMFFVSQMGTIAFGALTIYIFSGRLKGWARFVWAGMFLCELASGMLMGSKWFVIFPFLIIMTIHNYYKKRLPLKIIFGYLTVFSLFMMLFILPAIARYRVCYREMCAKGNNGLFGYNISTVSYMAKSFLFRTNKGPSGNENKKAVAVTAPDIELLKLSEMPGLYEKLKKEKKNIAVNQAIARLINETGKMRHEKFAELGDGEKLQLKKLNLLLIAQAYPNAYSGNFNANTGFLGSMSYIACRIHGLDSLMAVIKKTPDEIGYQYGRNILITPLIVMIPRGFWPGKPVLDFSREFAQKYWGTQPDEQNLLATTHMGDLYLNFGIVGLMLGCMFFGIMFRFAHEFCTAEGHDGRMLAYPFLLMHFAMIEGDIAAVYADLGKMLILIMLISWFLKTDIKRT